MGATISAARPSDEVLALLSKIGSEEKISSNDPYWNKLFNFDYHVDECLKDQVFQFANHFKDLSQDIFNNCQKNNNVITLVNVFLRRAYEFSNEELTQDKYYVQHTSNALLILRHIFTFFINEKEDTFLHDVLNANSGEQGYESPFDDDAKYENLSDELVSILLRVLVTVPVNEFSFGLHVEIIRTILALLGSELFSNNAHTTSIFSKYLFSDENSLIANKITENLFNNFLNHTQYLSYSDSARQRHEAEKPQSLVLSFGFAIYRSVVDTFTPSADSETNANDPFSSSDVQDKEISLSSLSCSLLLYLVCRKPSNGTENAYLLALEKFSNSQEISSSMDVEKFFRLDYALLYNQLCKLVHKQSAMLLLYMLLHKNMGFKNFVLSRINLENLVVPVLKVLNGADYENKRFPNESFADDAAIHVIDEPVSVLRKSHHIYLSLIVILILTEDDFFVKIIHESFIKEVNWYLPFKTIREISLGGLITLVIIKVIHMNTLKTRDRYLHTNCLAALANMSSSFKNLDPFVCHKLTSILIVMMKRHIKLIHSVRQMQEEMTEDEENENMIGFHHDITALEEGIRTILEMINTCLCNNLRSNPHLIYYMLYRREVFDTFRDHPMFQDLSDNIFAVINHFSLKLGDINDMSVEDILKAIDIHSLTWPTDRLKKFPDLKFNYVEDENTSGFFIPYIWRLIVSYSGIYFKPNSILLFNAQQS